MSQADDLPYCRHLIDEDDVEAVAAVLRGPFLTSGPAVGAFEADLAEAVGARHAVVCANGTAALHLTALALGLGPGDSVIVPAQTFAATANAARFVGAEAVLADVCPDTGLLRPEDLAEAIRRHRHRRLKAVYPVHLNGQPADMPALSALARAEGLFIVEDAAHALGSVDADGAMVGACRHSDMTIFSFHPAKTIAMGEGGAVTTNDPALAGRLKDFRSHGITREPSRFTQPELALDAEGMANPWYYEMQALGFNYRASDVNCALGRSQLAKLPHFSAVRRSLVASYRKRLAALSPLVRPLALRDGVLPTWHLAVALIDFAGAGMERATLMRRLKDLGIGTQVNYIPLHFLPYYRTEIPDLVLPGAEAYYRRCLSLPLSAAMVEDDVARVVEALAGVLA